MAYARSVSTANRVVELDFPVSADLLLRRAGHLNNFSLLESSLKVGKMGRYSFVAWDPFLVVKSTGNTITVNFAGREKKITTDPLDYINMLFRRYAVHYRRDHTPFIGGAIGYFGYELKNQIEKLPQTATADLGFPEMYLAFYDWALTIDEFSKRAYMSVINFDSGLLGPLERKMKARRKAIMDILEKPTASEPEQSGGAVVAENLVSNFTQEEYVAAVGRVKEYIAAGDIYQVNLSQRFSADLHCSPQAFYAKLNEMNPAPYSAFLYFDDKAVVCSSPERFLTKRGAEIETRPIKGTRPRGETPERDAELGAELLAAEKDNAELAMIVDLERNDLGKVCEFGSVIVEKAAELEMFPTVYHLVATVTGQVRSNVNIAELLKATFPGGSITGAPKIRAMEIIDELEPSCRSVYTGAIGYLGFNGDLDLNIVIRTSLFENGKIYFQVGGGIVADSSPEAEYQETLDKAHATIKTLNLSI